MRTEEKIECRDGIATFVRDGKKLVKVTFEFGRAPKEILHLGQIEYMDNCEHCGAWIEHDGRWWVDFTGYFTCLLSPFAMHKPRD